MILVRIFALCVVISSYIFFDDLYKGIIFWLALELFIWSRNNDKKFKEEEELLIKERFDNGWTLEHSFIQPLEDKGVSREISEYAYYGDSDEKAMTFPLIPEDDLWDVFLVEEKDIQLTLEKFASKFNKELPTKKKMDNLIYDQIETVEDLLITVQKMPNKETNG